MWVFFPCFCFCRGFFSVLCFVGFINNISFIHLLVFFFEQTTYALNTQVLNLAVEVMGLAERALANLGLD